MSIELEDKLWSRNGDSSMTWSEVASYLVDRLADYMSQSFTNGGVISSEDAFTCEIRNIVTASSDPLHVTWIGLLGMGPIQGKSWPSATLIPFMFGERIGIANHSGSTIELVFERRAGGLGQWRCEGWVEDVYGEWEQMRLPQQPPV